MTGPVDRKTNPTSSYELGLAVQEYADKYGTEETIKELQAWIEEMKSSTWNRER